MPIGIDPLCGSESRCYRRAILLEIVIQGGSNAALLLLQQLSAQAQQLRLGNLRQIPRIAQPVVRISKTLLGLAYFDKRIGASLKALQCYVDVLFRQTDVLLLD